MFRRFLLAAVPLVTVGIGALTFRGSPAAVPIERVELNSVEYVLAQEPQRGDSDRFRRGRLPPPSPNYRYRGDDSRYGYRYGSYLYHNRGGYRYADFPYRDPRYDGYRYDGYRYDGYRYSGYQYSGYRYSGYRYGGYRFSDYRYVNYQLQIYRYSAFGIIGFENYNPSSRQDVALREGGAD
jgi:hypothetical protein